MNSWCSPFYYCHKKHTPPRQKKLMHVSFLKERSFQNERIGSRFSRHSLSFFFLLRGGGSNDNCLAEFSESLNQQSLAVSAFVRWSQKPSFNWPSRGVSTCTEGDLVGWVGLEWVPAAGTARCFFFFLGKMMMMDDKVKYHTILTFVTTFFGRGQ